MALVVLASLLENPLAYRENMIIFLPPYCAFVLVLKADLSLTLILVLRSRTAEC